MTLEQLKLALAASGSLPGEVAVLEKIYPKLGKHTLAFMETESQKSDFKSLCHIVFRVVFDSFDAIEALKEGEESLVRRVVAESYNSSVYSFGKWAIPMVADVKKLERARKVRISRELNELLVTFEVDFYRLLPYEESVDLFKYDLISMVVSRDLLKSLQSTYLTAQYTRGDEWINQLKQGIESNQETLGAQQIILGNKRVNPEIQYWIQDYLVSSSRVASGRTTFDQIQYMQKAENTRTLNEKEKSVLVEILKVYNWLLRPRVVPEDEEEGGGER